MKLTFSRRALAIGMTALFIAALIPLVLVAFYNYPADDDFGFVLPVATAWVETGSLWQVLRAIGQKTWDTYQTWQGDFVSTALFSVTPMVFDIDLYFLDNWAMLALLCLSVGYLVKGLLRHVLGADKTTFWIVYPAVMVLVLQFMPNIAYSVYWHNGGQYTTAACTLFLLVGVLARCTQPQTKKRAVWRGVCAVLLGFMLGGSFYGPMLGALVLLFLLTLWAWKDRSRAKLPALLSLVALAAALVISVMAPGNALRQERTGETVSVVATLATCVLDSFDLCGKWLGPQWFAMLLLIAPVMWKPLRESKLTFRAPLWVFILTYGLFSASLAPGVYTGYGYTTERYFNVIYFYFLFMSLISVLYAEGALIRWLENADEKPHAAQILDVMKTLGSRFTALFLAAVIALTVFGGFEYTIMRTSSVAALKSLVTGEARQFHEEMKVREEYVRVTDSDVVAVKPLTVQPTVFKTDRLPFQGIYGRVRYMKWYYELFYEAEQTQ